MPGKDFPVVNPDFEELLLCLNHAKAQFLVIGAYAVIYHTEPRYTKDIDFWINPTRLNAERVFRALAKFGAPLKDVSVDDFCTPTMVYQIGIEPNRADIIMGAKGVSFAKAWTNRKIFRYGRARVAVIGIHELIATKRAAGRDHDAKDIAVLQRTLKLFTKTKSSRRK